MKIREIILLLLIFFISSSHAQDLIVTNEGDSLNCKITKQDTDYIYFTFNHKGEIRNTLLEISSILSFQNNYYAKPEIPRGKSMVKHSYPKIRIAVQGGWSYRIAKVPVGLESFYEDYIRQLKSGYNLGADFNYFITESLGLGFKYNYFNSKNRIDEVYVENEDGSMESGPMEDNININFYGPSLTSRVLSVNKNSAFITAVGLGYLSYKNKAYFIDDNLTISGNTFGMVLDLGYDIGLSEQMALGLQLSFTLGTLRKLEIDYGNYIDTIELESESYENLSRIDLSIGLRFIK